MIKLLNSSYSTFHNDALASIGFHATMAAQGRKDAAGDALFLARELEQVSAESYDVLTDPIMGRLLVPFTNELSEGAETYSFDMYTGVAKAEWISNYSTFVGNNDAFKVRTSFNARSFGSSYAYSVQDLAAAAMAGTGRSLDRERARMARRSHEQFIDDLIANGDTTRGIPGLINLLTSLGYSEATADGNDHPFVAPITGTWSGSTTSMQKIRDLQVLVDTPEQNTAGLFKTNRLVLPLSVKPLMNMTFDVADARTVEAVFKGNNPGVEVLYWSRLNTASAASGPRALAYQASPQVFKFVQAYDYREMPPQAQAYAYQIGTMARVVGLVPIYPLGMAQMDLDS